MLIRVVFELIDRLLKELTLACRSRSVLIGARIALLLQFHLSLHPIGLLLLVRLSNIHSLYVRSWTRILPVPLLLLLQVPLQLSLLFFNELNFVSQSVLSTQLSSFVSQTSHCL